MRSIFVVVDQLLRGDGGNLLKVGKHMGIQNLGSVSPVEPLDEGILVRFTGLDSRV